MPIKQKGIYVNSRILIFCAIALIQGCATSTNLRDTGEIKLEQNRDVVMDRLTRLAKQCWAKEYSTFQDAVIVQRSSYGLSVKRWAPDLGYESRQPMFKLRIMVDGDGSKLYMSEGECNAFCSDKSYSDDVTRWLSNDETCAE